MKNVFLFFVFLLVGCAPRAVPKFPIKVICFNGKIDSRASCSAENATNAEGGMTCGWIGQVSELHWEYEGSEWEADVYQFTRRFPVSGKTSTFMTKKIKFSGKRVIVFEDEHQVIVVDPASILKR